MREDTQLLKVKAHEGIAGNERADIEAKLCAESTDEAHNFDIEYTPHDVAGKFEFLIPNEVGEKCQVTKPTLYLRPLA